jgi:LPXTG-motif cell wall-anchored protein
MVASFGAMPFFASAAVPGSGCPAGTYESYTESFATPVDSLQVASLPITYVWVESTAGGYVFGDGTVLADDVIDVVGEIGAPATRAIFCKNFADTAIPTTLPESTTTTTLPDTTSSTTTTTLPETTTTSTTVPETTSTTASTTPATTTPAPTTTDPGTTTTTDAASSPPTTPASTTSTTTPIFGVLPPGQAAPPTVPPSTGAPTVTPVSATLPETGASSFNSLLLGTTVLGLGMLLIGLSRRSA